jgi:hypothetical protein
MQLKARVNERRQGTWRCAALNARYIRARVTICTVNSHFVYPVKARWGTRARLASETLCV